MHKYLTISLSIVIAALLSVGLSLAQDDCLAFVEQALSAVEDHCQTLGRNQACYGYNRVEAGFQMAVADDFFTQAADIADIADFQTIRTAPYDAGLDQWGVAVMTLQANLPETLPGQNVTFVLMGDTEVENAVPADAVFSPVEGIEVTVNYPQGAAIRSGAGDQFNTIGGVTVGTRFISDGINADGTWLRVIYEDRPGWIRRSVVADEAAIDSLPVLGSDVYTPMQAFYLRTGIGQPACSSIPDNSLLVQGPEDITVQLTVNGADIELGSSGLLRVIASDGAPQLEITVLDGQFVVKADDFTPQDVVIQAGQRSVLCLDAGNNLGTDGEANDLTVSCGASAPQTVDPLAFSAAWCQLEGISDRMLSYPLQTCVGSHTVQAGENLFRIASYYCVSLDEMVALNGISDPSQITVGQLLLVPANACDGEGQTVPPPSAVTVISDNGATPVPDVPANVDDNDTANGVDCSAFSVPPQPVTDTVFQLDWGDVPGATDYTVAVFDNAHYEVGTYATSQSSIALDGGRFPSVGYVDVRAYRNGAYACYARMSFTRQGTPVQAPVDTGNFTATLASCTYSPDATAVIQWSGADTLPVVVEWEEGNYITYSQSFGSTSGSTTLIEVFGFNYILVKSGGQTISLGGC